MATTRDLENQAEADRAQVALTLEQLRGRMSTGQLFDQAVAYARGHGGAEFMRNLGDHVKVNPLPVALITAGIGWLMAGSRRPAGYAPSIVPDESPYDRRFAHKARETSGEVANSLRESSQGLAERAGRAMAAAREGAEEATSSAHGAMSDARDGLSSAYSAASDAAGRATSKMSDTAAAIGRRAHDARDHAAEFGRGAAEFGRDAADRARQVGSSMSDRAARAQTAMSRLIEEQPLIVGAVGIAIGAMLGAWLPRSRREDELIGEASASVKEQAAGVARDQFDHLKEAGGRFVEKVRGEAEQQGLTPDSAQELARDIGAKVSAVAAAAKEGAVDEMKSAKENAENKIGSAEESNQSKPEPASSEGAHAQEAAGSERFSEVDPRALPTGTGNPADPSLKTAERVG